MVGMSVADKFQKIREKLPAHVKLVAVSKFHGPEKVREAASAGATEFGENYVQEALEKIQACTNLKLNWHFIGGIQSNKIKNIVGNFALIQSVDNLSHVKKISAEAQVKKMQQNILIQVNVADEESKSGVSLTDLVSFYTSARDEAGVNVKGLMCLPPLTAEVAEKRKSFRQMKKVFDELKLEILSMGTSHDYLVAIEEGSNMVRIGTEIFGERK